MAASSLVSERERTSLPTEGMNSTATPGAEGTALAPTLRGVRAVRLSVWTDETTSPDRQREADDRAAAELNIGFGEGDALREAVDLDVSASKTSPFERPELGKWLARPDEFDAVVWWRFDRAIRSMAHMHDLAKWARAHRKMLVFAEGIGGGGTLKFDFRNPLDPISELMMTFFAFAAQVEAQSIKERVTGAQAAMRMMPLRWRGSRPHFGYMPAPLEGGGWTLVPDPDAVKIIERMIRELMGGKTASQVAADLNADGIPSPRDYWAEKKNRALGGKTGGAKGEATTRERFKWGPSIVKRVLTSPVLIGWKTHKGNPVRDSTGAPVMATTEPILTRAEYDAVCALFEERAIEVRERSDTDALLLRVIHCAGCGGRMYLNKQKTKKNQQPVYKCNSHARGEICENPSNVRADWVDEYVEREFLRLVARIQVHTVQVVPGYDPAPEIAATLAEFEEHQKQKGRQKSKAAAKAWQARADALDNRLAELENTPKIEPRREMTPTGRTYADEWHAADTAGRRAMLVDAGARLTVRRGTRGGWRTLDERRVQFEVRGELDGPIEELAGLVEELEPQRAESAPTRARVRLHRLSRRADTPNVGLVA
jgi:DNA invertase Pin-like site-specific DNA recombinase